MRVLVLCGLTLALIGSACTPHEVRCEGRLERINVPGTPSTADAQAGVGAQRVVP